MLSDGRVFAAGGNVASGLEVIAGTDLYGPVNKMFTPAAKMISLRQRHKATLLLDGRVLATGGFDGTGNVSSAEIYTRGP